MCMVRLLVTWCKNLSVQVTCGTCLEPFALAKGVRQGRVLSPYVLACMG